ncbi:hypothetical protein [Devosia sp.]|uniref:hypothetical protein n=1 Tax=Devosia sp. TaxID=1871048 RepID=UPI0032658789
MTALLLRVLIFGAIGIAIYLGVSKIWRDVTSQFRNDEAAEKERRRARDLSERQRPDVIDLKRDDDGTFRPGGKNEKR